MNKKGFNWWWVFGIWVVLISLVFMNSVNEPDYYSSTQDLMEQEMEEDIMKDSLVDELREEAMYDSMRDDLYDSMRDDLYDYSPGDNMGYEMMMEDLEREALGIPAGAEKYNLDCDSNIYNCADFPTQLVAQTMLNFCMDKVGVDIHYLDGDSDGIACESLP